MVPDPLPLAYAVYAFINVDNCERPLNKLSSALHLHSVFAIVVLCLIMGHPSIISSSKEATNRKCDRHSRHAYFISYQSLWPVWSTSLPKYLSDAIEMIQKRVLRSIHPGLHYDDILVLIGLQSLKMRPDNICKAYFNRLKCNTHRLNHLIPERRDVHYSLRNANVYPIPVIRTDRYKNSIVPWGLCNW